MAKCFRCDAETKLYSNGVPICVPCDDALEKGTAQKPEPPLSNPPKGLPPHR